MFNVEEYNRYYNDVALLNSIIKEDILKHKNQYHCSSNQAFAKAVYDRLVLTYPESTYYEDDNCQYICVTKKATVMLCNMLMKRRNELISQITSMTEIIDLINA